MFVYYVNNAVFGKIGRIVSK